MIKSFVTLQNYVAGLLNRDDRGATAVEYGLMVALIAAVIIIAVAAIGNNLNTVFTNVGNALQGV